MDKNLKHKIKTVKVDWDKEQLWNELEPKLPKKKSNFLWIGFYCLLLLSTGFIWCISFNKINKSEHIVFSNQNEKDVVENSLGNSSDTKILLEETNVLKLENQLVAKQNEQYLKSRSKTPILSTIDNETKFGSIKNIPEVIKLQENIIGETVNRIDFSKPGILPKTRNSNSNSNSSNQIDSKIPKPSSDNSITKKDNNSVSVKSALESEEKLELIAFFLLLNSKLELLSYTYPLPKSPKFKSEPQTKNQIYLECSGMIGLLKRKFTPQDTDTENNLLLKEHKALEETLFKSGFQLGMGYQLKKGWLFESGIQYQQIHELFKLEENTTTDNFIVNSERAFYQFDGPDTIFYNGPVSAMKISNRNIVHNNTLSYFSIPIAVGYQMSSGRFSIRGTAGINFVLSSKFKGRIMDLGNNVLDNPAVSLKNQIAYQFSLGAAYQIIRKTDVFLNFGYKQSPSFIINNNYQSYQSLNLKLGLRISIF